MYKLIFIVTYLLLFLIPGVLGGLVLRWIGNRNKVDNRERRKVVATCLIVSVLSGLLGLFLMDHANEIVALSTFIILEVLYVLFVIAKWMKEEKIHLRRS